ncbi:MAG: hypothetical protein ACE5HE_11295, partial [Phycisphaerae bacterium]
MLVVILIVAIAVAMLLPSLKRSMVLARSAVCMHNLREVGQGLRLYQFENDGWLPGAHVAADGERPESINAVWFVPLCRSFLDPSALTCPSDPFRYRMLQARDRLTDPAVADYPSYGISSLALYGRGGTLADVDRRMPTRPLDTILVADLGPDNRPAEQPVEHKRPEPGKPTMTVTATVSLSSANAGPQRNGSLLSWDDGYDPLAFDTPPTWLTVRHADGVNMLTLAGGVRSARTANLLRRPVLRYYPDCEAGGCSLCIAR